MVLLRGFHSMATFSWHPKLCQARLAQSVEHQTFNLRVAGSSPSSGGDLFCEERNFQLVFSDLSGLFRAMVLIL